MRTRPTCTTAMATEPSPPRPPSPDVPSEEGGARRRSSSEPPSSAEGARARGTRALGPPGGEGGWGVRAVRLGDWTTEALRVALAAGRPVVALVPVGSVEPHGPHLPLATDTIISEAAADRAVARLAVKG